MNEAGLVLIDENLRVRGSMSQKEFAHLSG
jgi:hypothetical protein